MKKATIAVTLVVMLASPLIRAQSVDYSPEFAEVMLANGCNVGDKTPLLEFLHHWHQESTPISPDVLAKKPAFEQAVYALYGPFFAPEAKRVDAKYLIIQSDVDVHLVEADLEKAYREELRTFQEVSLQQPVISKVTIHSFQPNVAVGEKKLVHYKLPYIAAMVQFLTGKQIEIEDSWNEPNGIFERDNEHKERRDRLGYLNTNLRIVPGLHNSGWHFTTQPEISCIVLSIQLDTAVVYYNSVYSSAIALVHLQDGKWIVIEREQTEIW